MSVADIVVIDYGAANLLSVKRGFEHCGATVNVTSNPREILEAKRVVLPGVGAFPKAMESLEKLGLVRVIKEVAQCQKPLLGICLGMQLLLEESEEFGLTSGIGLIPGRVIAIPTRAISDEPLKVPHIGWSSLKPTDTNIGWRNSLLKNNIPGEAVYFVHSFMAVPSNHTHRIADFEYGGRLVTAAIGHDQITGCQFHPEKSGEVGLKILRQFLLE